VAVHILTTLCAAPTEELLVLDRRRFVSTALSASALAIMPNVWAHADGATVMPSFIINPEKPIAHIPGDFTGLSYESSQLVHSSFFSASNSSLVTFFRTLGESGVLRIGGNMSEFTTWSNVDLAEGAEDGGTEGPDPGKRDVKTYTITPRSIRTLSDFLVATNWKLIYGLNLARGTAKNAADEAACVMRICGPRLLAFQFGNEPDLFKHNGDPKDRWTYPEFIEKWNTFEKAVRAMVPSAPLAGPDTSFKPEWVGNFATDTKGKTFLLTAHYYAEGPPTNPDMTIARLLTDQAKFSSNILRAADLARKAGMPYRMSEGNTCYNAGKKGVSDTFASALWAGDFMAQVAAVGGTGVNLHGGGNGLYTPIAGSPREGLSARPDYYGMLFVRPLLGATMLSAELNTQGENISAYAVQKKGKVTLLAFNKSNKDTSIEVALPTGYTGASARIVRLTAPAIDATEDVRLGGAAVGSDGTWKPTADETISAKSGKLRLTLPAYSAASAHFA
jgi:hypothetical protein